MYINVTITQYWLNTSKGEGMNEIDIEEGSHTCNGLLVESGSFSILINVYESQTLDG